jgi:hypothetical protein
METTWLTLSKAFFSSFSFRGLLVGFTTVVFVDLYWSMLKAWVRFAWHNAGLVLILALLYGFIYQEAGEDYGIPALFWNEDRLNQFYAGMASTMLIGLLLILAFYKESVHSKPNQPGQFWDAMGQLRASGWPWKPWKWIDAHRLATSHFYRLSVYLAVVGTPLLVYLAIPAFWPAGSGGPLITPDVGVERYWSIWLAGIVAGVVVMAVILIISIFLFDYVIVRIFLRGIATDANMDDPDNDDALSASLTTTSVLTVASYIVMAWPCYRIVTAAFAICALLGVVGVIYSALFFALLGSERNIRPFGIAHPRAWTGAVLALFLLLASVANHRPYSYHFPGLSYAPVDRVDLCRRFMQEDTESRSDGVGCGPGAFGAVRAEMVNDSAALSAWQGGPSVPNRTLVVVAVSGGGVRAAAWTAVVLKTLEEKIPDFSYHVRLVTGASGGMVGAALFVESVDPQGTNAGNAPHAPGVLEQIVDVSSRDGLTRVAKHLVLRDLPRSFLPIELGPIGDRGTELQRTWAPPTPGGPRLDVPLSSLADGELQGWRPSIVFSPMLAQDGRRLMISNIDLDGLTRTHAERIDGDLPGLTGRRLLSITTIQFFEYFPNQTQLTMGTALRMNASFPLLSPAVSLPTSPPRTPIDAGYYDDYGVNIAASWIYEHRDWLSHHTANVLLIQIRDTVSEYQRRQVADTAEEKVRSWSPLDLFDIPALTTPLSGLFSATSASMSFRNDEQIEVISDWFHSARGARFHTVVFENPSPAALSWYLTRKERALIEAGMGGTFLRASLRPLLKGDRVHAVIAANVQRLEHLRELWRHPGHEDDNLAKVSR